MLAIAFEAMATAQGLEPELLPHLVKRIGWMVRRVAEGQQLDIDFEGQIAVSEEEYFEMIEGKTAVMFLTCAEIGAHLAGADDEIISCMHDWGLAVGLCFQLMDDLIDVVSDSETLGKPAGSDVAQGKRTLMVIHALSQMDSPPKQDLLAVLGKGESATTEEVEKGKWVAVLYTLLTDSAAVMIGMIGRYILTNSGQDPELVLGPAGENVLSILLVEVMPTVIIGIYIAAVLSAVMSTVDSLLVVASSAVTRDFYQHILNPDVDETKLMGFSKKVTLALAVLALGVALAVSVLSPTRTVFWFVIFGWSGIAATFCPVIILSIFWKDLTEKGAIASMITGFLCIPFFKFIVPGFSTIGPYINKLDVMLPSVFLAMLMGWGVSIFVKD